jgi:subtilisin
MGVRDRRREYSSYVRRTHGAGPPPTPGAGETNSFDGSDVHIAYKIEILKTRRNWFWKEVRQLMTDNTVSRRRVLQGIGAGVAATGMAGQVSANGDGSDGHIVGLDAGAGFEVARQRATEVRAELDFGDIGKAVAGQFPEQALDGLQNNPNVRYVEENGRMHKLAQRLPWGIDRVDADVLHADGQDASGATIAVLDTGLDDDHPDLGANVVGGKAFETECGAESGGCRFGGEGYNGNDCNYAWSDDDDHGTHCAGTADAVDDTEGVVGVSTAADLLAGKVLTGCGSGSYSAIASGIKWATDQGADVISMSLGGDSGSSALQDACQYAYDNNVVSVAAAGNSGPCSDCVGYPAAYSTVVAVSATAEDDTLADYSSTGAEVELAAPGSNVLSTIPPESDDGSTYENGYTEFSGTSMATPHVSGAAAQVIANTDITDNQKVIDRLKSTAEDIGLGSNESGAGLVDAENAVGSGGGGDTDTAPSVSFANPADGETVSGTVTVQISASDEEDADDSLDVSYTVDGGSSRTATYNSTSGYYEDSWDTTTVSDGDHTLEASATDSAGNTSSSSITVTTDNTEDTSSAPTVDSHSVSTRTTGPWTRVTTDWAVSDDDGDLSSVTVELVDSSGTVQASTETAVSGSSASGSDEIKTRSSVSESVVTVTDAAGNTDSSSRSV